MEDPDLDTLAQVIAEQLTRRTQRSLAGRVRDLVEGGTLPPGIRLPPIRVVADATGMSASAVGEAWRILVRDNVLRTSTKAGTVVVGPPRFAAPARYLRNMSPVPSGLVDLGAPHPDPAFLPPLEEAVIHALALPDLQRAERVPVIPELEAVTRATWPYPAESFLAVHRPIEAVELTFRTFVKPGDVVAIEDPTTPRVIDNAEASGARILPVPWTDGGPDLRSLRRALAEASVFVYQPTAQTPTGRSVTAQWLALAADAARASRTRIVELVHDPLLHAGAPTLGHTLPQSVIRVHGYAMSHGNDVRVALVSGTSSVVEALGASAAFTSLWVSRLLQGTLAHLLADSDSAALIVRASREYHRRAGALVDELAAHGFDVMKRDGVRIWLPVADEARVREFMRRAGIHVHGGSSHTLRKGKTDHIVLNGAAPVADPRTLAELVASADRAARAAA